MDVSEQNFQTAVIERSRTLPAVVAGDGRLELAKLDIDANPTLARTWGIQSIPAVKAFSDGTVAAEFVGAQPPVAVERFLDSLLPSEADRLVALGDEESLRRAAELEPARADAAVPLARILYGRGEPDEALAVLRRVPGSFAAEGLAGRRDGERRAPGAELSEAFAALDAGEYERALDLLIGALPSADGSRDDIRRVVVGILDELGVEHPLARESRRKLASALY